MRHQKSKHSKGTGVAKEWNSEWSKRRYTIRLSPEADVQAVAHARKMSMEASRSITVPDLIEQAFEIWLLEVDGKLEVIKKRRSMKA